MPPYYAQDAEDRLMVELSYYVDDPSDENRDAVLRAAEYWVQLMKKMETASGM